ncbi:MAG: ribosome biogenesis factor YjgA [Vibrionaceae bacterium]
MARKNRHEPWDEEPEEIIIVSRSELKRDVEELQKLGEALVELKPAALAKIPLDEELHHAVTQARTFEREAKRRQLQYIGKLMRSRDPEPIQDALNVLRNKDNQQAALLHKLETLRNKIVELGDAAINEVVSQFPQADRQKLRQLARVAKKEQLENRPPKAYREIFQYLKSLHQES